MGIEYYAVLMILIGIFMTICGIRKCDFVIYQFLVKKSGKLWGKHVHKFYVIAGLIIVAVGIQIIIGTV